jgi:hypothetical protein
MKENVSIKYDGINSFEILTVLPKVVTHQYVITHGLFLSLVDNLIFWWIYDMMIKINWYFIASSTHNFHNQVYSDILFLKIYVFDIEALKDFIMPHSIKSFSVDNYAYLMTSKNIHILIIREWNGMRKVCDTKKWYEMLTWQFFCFEK